MHIKGTKTISQNEKQIWQLMLESLKFHFLTNYEISSLSRLRGTIIVIHKLCSQTNNTIKF